MRRLAPIFCVGFAFAFGGCLLGIDNLEGGTGSGSPSNDGGVSGDATSSDGSSSSDGSVLDSSTTADGGNDGGRFCPQMGALLCSDFDDVDVVTAIPGPWDSAYAPSPGLIVTNTALFKSAPRSAKMSTSGAAGYASLAKGVTASHVKLSFDVFMEAIGSNTNVAAFAVAGAGGVSFRPPGILEEDTLSDGGTFYGSTSGAGIPTGTWVHIDCVMDLTTHVATISQNGIQTVSRSLESTAAWTGPRSINVVLGFGDSNNTTIDYDNVTITIE